MEARAKVRALQPPEVESLSVEEVTLRGVLQDMGGSYLFQGRLTGTFAHPCDRCLEEALAPFDIEVLWNFEHGPEMKHNSAEFGAEDLEGEDADDAADWRMFQGDEIDLGPCIWEELVLQAPIKYVCREDCAGLCPECGANLNTAPCSCRREDAAQWRANTGLAGLADMFPDLARKKPKE